MTTWSDYPVTREYVTEISVPDFGDGGIQRLHSKPLEEKEKRKCPRPNRRQNYEPRQR